MCVCMWSKDGGGLHVCVEGRVRDHVCVFVFVFVCVCVECEGGGCVTVYTRLRQSYLRSLS